MLFSDLINWEFKYFISFSKLYRHWYIINALIIYLEYALYLINPIY